MPPSEADLRAVVAEWLAFAEEDLQSAGLLRAAGHVRSATYHAQQAAEKFVKAALIRHQVTFGSRSHELFDLRHSLNTADPGLAATLAEADELSRYATARRYPGGGRPVSAEQAKDAVALAGRVGERVRATLATFLAPPKDAG